MCYQKNHKIRSMMAAYKLFYNKVSYMNSYSYICCGKYQI